MRALLLIALAALVAVLLLTGCAGLEPRPAPLTRAEVIMLAKTGASPQVIIGELERTRTVILLSGTDIVQLSNAGVPREVLDYLQRVQIEQVRQDERFAMMYYYPPLYRGAYPCFGPMRPYFPGPAYRGWYWPCF
jgi:hypothetical protein